MKAILLFGFALTAAAAEQRGETQRDMTPWLWANFILLLAALGYLAMKYGGPFLKARQEGIQKGIADAEAEKAGADRRVAEVNERLANLDTEIANLKSQMREEQAQEAERLAARNAAELARIQQQAEQEMEAAAKAARLDLQAHAGKLAVELAEQKLRARMNPATQHELAQSFMDRLVQGSR
ncbi:MAG: ATP synthase F0 subunit B [Acidobacteriota bacterium]|nr:ATP synthase F0 subunit B [Acidobacteriota bacterium]